MEPDLVHSEDVITKQPSPSNNKLRIKHFFYKFKWPLGIVLLLIVFLFLLFYAINKNSSPQKNVSKNQVTTTANPTTNWQMYIYGFLHFSIKYPADLLTPGFLDIDPSTRVNRYSVAVDQKAVIYGNEAYKSADFSMTPSLSLGGLVSKNYKLDRTNYLDYSDFYNITVGIQYFDKDISWLKGYYAKYNTPVTFLTINGISVAVVDTASSFTNADGNFSAINRTYYFKIGGNILSITALNPNTIALKNYVFPYLDQIAKSFKEDVDVSDLPTPTPDTCTKSFDNINTSIDATIMDLPDSNNWMSYTMPNEKLSFKYPSDWKIEGNTNQPGQNGFPYLTESVSLTSPNGFKIGISTGGQGFGGGCEYNCQCENLDNYVLGTLNFKSSPEYIVVHGLKENSVYGNASIRFEVIPYKYCWDNLCYPDGAKNTQGVLSISGTWNNSKFMQPNAFISSPDVKTAVSILETLHY